MALCRRLTLLTLPLLVASGNVQRCGFGDGLQGKVLSVSDGKNERCISVVTPSTSSEALPILFFFHGSGGSAQHCGASGPGSSELGQLAIDQGFALVCGEALQYDRSSGENGEMSGLWQIPQVQTNSTGTPCKDSDSIEIGYIKNAITLLGQDNAGLPKMDTSRIFTSGCSLGSAFSEYTANCLKARSPSVLSSFATHSSGLKTKGDGNKMPWDNSGNYEWGECPKCQYWPFVPKKYSDSLGLKACVFDNTGDNIPIGDFYKTSQELVKTWTDLGMKVESSYGSGGHCQIHSFAAIVNCLDDGTKRLLRNGPAPSPTPGDVFVV